MEYKVVYTNYEINKEGIIRNVNTKKELKVTDGKVWIQIGGKSKQMKIEKILSELSFEEVENTDVIEEVVEEIIEDSELVTGNKSIKITFLDGTSKIYSSPAQATRELGIKNKNSISSYWMKGYCLKGMGKYNILSIERFI